MEVNVVLRFFVGQELKMIINTTKHALTQRSIKGVIRRPTCANS